MQKPKLVLVTLEFPPDVGGIARYLGGLVDASHGDILVIIDSSHGVASRVRSEKYDLFQYAWPHWLPMVGICRFRQSRQEIILVSHVFPVGTAAWISRLLGGADYVVFFHGTDVRRVTGWWKNWLLRQIVTRARLTVVNSESTKRELRTKIPSIDPLVLLPAVEERKFPSKEDARQALGIAADEFVVLSVARLIPRKGIDAALRTIAEIQRSQPVKYTVIGDGPAREDLRRLQEECGADALWITRSDDDTVNRWYAAADVFLGPGRDDGDDVEGFGMVFLEAGQAGLPVIAGRNGGVAEAVVDNVTGFIVDATSVSDVVTALRRLMVDPALRERMGDAGKSRAGLGFQWSNRWAMLMKAIQTP